MKYPRLLLCQRRKHILINLNPFMRACQQIQTNAVLSVTREYPSGELIEPVNLQTMKDYLKITYTEDDALITTMIRAAREWVEKRCGITLVASTITALLEVMNEIELPYGPIYDSSTIVVEDMNGEVVENPSIRGLDGSFFYLRGYGQFTVSYSIGNVWPQELRLAIMAKVASNYEHRGDELDESNVDYARIAKKLSDPFKRTIGF